MQTEAANNTFALFFSEIVNETESRLSQKIVNETESRLLFLDNSTVMKIKLSYHYVNPILSYQHLKCRLHKAWVTFKAAVLRGIK